MVHLTNDAVQKKGGSYGKFEDHNKLSYKEFELYLERRSSIPKGRFRKTLKRIKELSRDLVESVSSKINPQRKEFCFEVQPYLCSCSVWTLCWIPSSCLG